MYFFDLEGKSTFEKNMSKQGVQKFIHIYFLTKYTTNISFNI